MKISVDKNNYIKYKISYLENKIDELIDAGLFNEVDTYENKKTSLINLYKNRNSKENLGGNLEQEGGFFFGLDGKTVIKKFVKNILGYADGDVIDILNEGYDNFGASNIKKKSFKKFLDNVNKASESKLVGKSNILNIVKDNGYRLVKSLLKYILDKIQSENVINKDDKKEKINKFFILLSKIFFGDDDNEGIDCMHLYENNKVNYYNNLAGHGRKRKERKRKLIDLSKSFFSILIEKDTENIINYEAIFYKSKDQLKKLIENRYKETIIYNIPKIINVYINILNKNVKKSVFKKTKKISDESMYIEIIDISLIEGYVEDKKKNEDEDDNDRKSINEEDQTSSNKKDQISSNEENQTSSNEEDQTSSNEEDPKSSNENQKGKEKKKISDNEKNKNIDELIKSGGSLLESVEKNVKENLIIVTNYDVNGIDIPQDILKKNKTIISYNINDIDSAINNLNNSKKFIKNSSEKKTIDEGIENYRKILFIINFYKELSKISNMNNFKEEYGLLLKNKKYDAEIKKYQLEDLFRPYEIILFENLDENSKDKEENFEKLCIKTFCNNSKEWKKECYHKNALKTHPDRNKNDLIKQEMFKHLSNCNEKLTEKKNVMDKENKIVSKLHLQMKEMLHKKGDKIDFKNNQLTFKEDITDSNLKKIYDSIKKLQDIIIKEKGDPKKTVKYLKDLKLSKTFLFNNQKVNPFTVYIEIIEKEKPLLLQDDLQPSLYKMKKSIDDLNDEIKKLLENNKLNEISNYIKSPEGKLIKLQNEIEKEKSKFSNTNFSKSYILNKSYLEFIIEFVEVLNKSKDIQIIEQEVKIIPIANDSIKKLLNDYLKIINKIKEDNNKIKEEKKKEKIKEKIKSLDDAYKIYDEQLGEEKFKEKPLDIFKNYFIPALDNVQKSNESITILDEDSELNKKFTILYNFLNLLKTDIDKFYLFLKIYYFFEAKENKNNDLMKKIKKNLSVIMKKKKEKFKKEYENIKVIDEIIGKVEKLKKKEKKEEFLLEIEKKQNFKGKREIGKYYEKEFINLGNNMYKGFFGSTIEYNENYKKKYIDFYNQQCDRFKNNVKNIFNNNTEIKYKLVKDCENVTNDLKKNNSDFHVKCSKYINKNSIENIDKKFNQFTDSDEKTDEKINEICGSNISRSYHSKQNKDKECKDGRILEKDIVNNTTKEVCTSSKNNRKKIFDDLNKLFNETDETKKLDGFIKLKKEYKNDKNFIKEIDILIKSKKRV